jgi:hypothetical protein
MCLRFDRFLNSQASISLDPVLSVLYNTCAYCLLPYNLAYKPPQCGPCETNASLVGGAYSKGIYYCRWSVRHTNFAATLRQEGAYMRGGLIAKGGLICQIIR